MYHYITVQIVMRDCDSNDDARKKCGNLMPQYPDENTTHMESWEIVEVREAKRYRRTNDTGHSPASNKV